MTIITELADFRIDMACDILQLPDIVWTRYYNDSRDELIDAIIEEKEDYFYNSITTSTVVDQNEYLFPVRDANQDWLQKVKWISWELNSTDDALTPIYPKTLENLDYDLESYDDTINPFYLVQDNSLFIYPAPKEITTLKIYGILYPKKLLGADVDTLPDQYTKVLMYWLKSRWLESQLRIPEAQEARAKFEVGILKVCNALSGRIQAPVQRDIPNINYLK